MWAWASTFRVTLGSEQWRDIESRSNPQPGSKSCASSNPGTNTDSGTNTDPYTNTDAYTNTGPYADGYAC